MKKILCLLLLIIVCFLSYTQDRLQQKPKVFKATVSTLSGSSTKGFIKSFSDSALILTSSSDFMSTDHNAGGSSLLYHQLNEVRIQRKNSALRGTLIGTVTGFAVGALIAVIEGDDPPVPPEEDFWGLGNMFRYSTGEKVAMYGTAGATIGSVGGVVIGLLAKKKFIINGRKEKFHEMSTSVLDRMYGSPIQ